MRMSRCVRHGFWAVWRSHCVVMRALVSTRRCAEAAMKGLSAHAAPYNRFVPVRRKRGARQEASR